MSTANREIFKELFERGLVWHAENENFAPAQMPQQVSSKYTSASPEIGNIGVPELDHSLQSGGWKKGAIHEFFYSANKFLSPPITIPSILATQSCKEIFWIGKQAWPTPFLLERLYPPTSHAEKVTYKESCFFIDAPDRKIALWSIETILRGSAACCVIADCSNISFTLSRRLALAAEDSRSLLILLRDNKYARSPSSAVTRWQLSQALSLNEHPSWELKLLQCRGKEPARKTWILEEQYGEKISLRLSTAMEGIPQQHITRQNFRRVAA